MKRVTAKMTNNLVVEFSVSNETEFHEIRKMVYEIANEEKEKVLMIEITQK